MVVLGARRGRVLYACCDVQAFQDVERYSDYREVMSRIRRTRAKGVSVASNRKPGWRSLVSIRTLAIVTAVGTVALVVIGVVALVH